MKIYVQIFAVDAFLRCLAPYTEADFSLFVECFPTEQRQLSGTNVILLQEPNEYTGLHDKVIENRHLFQLILTTSDKVLHACDQAVFLPFGHSWLDGEQLGRTRQKRFEVAHLAGRLNKTYGHGLRHELIDRAREIKIPTNFYRTIGSRYDISDARVGKEVVFGWSQFGVAIENVSHCGYFTEKILDCFLLRTVPLYWGCPNIGEFFNSQGIIDFSSVDDLIRKLNVLSAGSYERLLPVIDENYRKALQYLDYEGRACEVIGGFLDKKYRS